MFALRLRGGGFLFRWFRLSGLDCRHPASAAALPPPRVPEIRLGHAKSACAFESLSDGTGPSFTISPFPCDGASPALPPTVAPQGAVRCALQEFSDTKPAASSVSPSPFRSALPVQKIDVKQPAGRRGLLSTPRTASRCSSCFTTVYANAFAPGVPRAVSAQGFPTLGAIVLAPTASMAV